MYDVSDTVTTDNIDAPVETAATTEFIGYEELFLRL